MYQILKEYLKETLRLRSVIGGPSKKSFKILIDLGGLWD